MSIRPNAKFVFAIRMEFGRRLRVAFRKRSGAVAPIGRKNFGRRLDRLEGRLLRRLSVNAAEVRHANYRNWKKNSLSVASVPLNLEGRPPYRPKLFRRPLWNRTDGTEPVPPLLSNRRQAVRSGFRSSVFSINFTS